MRKILVLLLAGFFLLGCSTAAPQGKGFLEGKISIGPICPVERFPPEPQCRPTEQTFQAYPLTVYLIGNGDPGILIKETEFHGGTEGNYRIELAAGSYVVRQETGLSRFSETVEINANETTRLDIDIDTGIR